LMPGRTSAPDEELRGWSVCHSAVVARR